MKAPCEQNDRTEGHGLVSAVHNTLHTAVLYARFLLQAVLRDPSLAQQIGNALRNCIVDCQIKPPRQQFFVV